MLEHRKQSLLPRQQFVHRMVLSGWVATGLLSLSLLIGIAGYHYLEGLAWLDALLNAAMILGGMGPVDPLHSDAGKLFAAAYALFSGVMFLTIFGVLAVPILHRLLHRFHLDDDEK